MKKLIVFVVIIIFLPGCAGLAVGTFGTYEFKADDFAIDKEKNKFREIEYKKYTKEEIISVWGVPDESGIYKNCEYITYYDGYSWSGIGAYLIIIPIPLLVPSGQDENKFYFRNGESVGVVKEYGEIVSALGYLCGSNECNFYAGRVNEKARVARVHWCE